MASNHHDLRRSQPASGPESARRTRTIPRVAGGRQKGLRSGSIGAIRLRPAGAAVRGRTAAPADIGGFDAYVGRWWRCGAGGGPRPSTATRDRRPGSARPSSIRTSARCRRVPEGDQGPPAGCRRRGCARRRRPGPRPMPISGPPRPPRGQPAADDAPPAARKDSKSSSPAPYPCRSTCDGSTRTAGTAAARPAPTPARTSMPAATASVAGSCGSRP